MRENHGKNPHIKQLRTAHFPHLFLTSNGFLQQQQNNANHSLVNGMVQTSLPMISKYNIFFKHTEGRDRSSRLKYLKNTIQDYFQTSCSMAMVTTAILFDEAFYASSCLSVTCRTLYQPFQSHHTPKAFTFD